MMQQINLYDAFNNCNKEALVRQFADMVYNDTPESSRLEKAMSIVEQAYERMRHTTIQKQEKPPIVFVCKTYDENITDTFYTDAFYIEQDDYVKWVQGHKDSPAKLAIQDDKPDEMKTDDIFAAIQKASFPPRYAFELTEWEKILGWDLFVPCVDAYGLPDCLATIMWEMTVFGISPERMHEIKAELSKRKEECDEIFEEYKNDSEHTVPKGYTSFEDIAKELLGDEYTEDWYPEEEQKRDMKNLAISTYKTNREYEQLLFAGMTKAQMLGKRIQFLAEQNGMSVADMAKFLDHTEAQILDLYKGEAFLKFSKLEGLAKRFGINVQTLLQTSDEENKE
jgi:hypothetical protein